MWISHGAQKSTRHSIPKHSRLFFIASTARSLRHGGVIDMEKAAAASSRSFSFRAGLVAAYLTLNTVLNLTTKWILSSTTGYGFTFPLALTCCHMAIISVALLPHMLSRTLRSTHKDSILKQWKGLLAIGTLMAADAAFNNSSLVNMSLSLNQIIR